MIPNRLSLISLESDINYRVILVYFYDGKDFLTVDNCIWKGTITPQILLTLVEVFLLVNRPRSCFERPILYNSAVKEDLIVGTVISLTFVIGRIFRKRAAVMGKPFKLTKVSLVSDLIQVRLVIGSVSARNETRDDTS